MKAPADLRRTLLDASLSLIAQEGLEGFSMREVARRAGVSHQAPYHHFPDREAILAAIVAEGFEGLRDSSRAAAEGVADPIERLAAIGKAYIAFALEHPAHFKLMFRSELVRADKHEDAKACAEGAYQVLVDVTDAVAGHRGEAPSQALLLCVWSVAHGIATLVLEGKLDAKLENVGDRAAAAEAVIVYFAEAIRRS